MVFTWVPLLLSTLALAAPLSLRDAALYAVDHSPSLDTSERNLIIAGLNRQNTVAAFLPSLDLTSSHGLLRNYPRASPFEPYSSSFSLALTENLYDNGESLKKHEITVVQEEASRLNATRDRDLLFLSVANAYYDLCLAKKALEIQQEQHAVLRLQVELVRDSYRQGVKTRKDFLRFQTQLNRSDIELVNVRDTVSKAEIDLKRAMGVPLESQDSFAFALDEQRPELVAPLRIRIQEHRDYQIAQLQQHVADLTADLVRRRQYPILGLTTGASFGSADYLLTGQGVSAEKKTSWNALVGLSYNFFDFGLRRRNTEIASQQAAIQADTLDSGLLDLRQQIDKLAIDRQSLAESFRLSEELFHLERSNLALITNEYRQGKVQYLDYITSLQDFANAKSTYFTSLYGLRKSLLAERYHQGTLHEAIQGP